VYVRIVVIFLVLLGTDKLQTRTQNFLELLEVTGGNRGHCGVSSVVEKPCTMRVEQLDPDQVKELTLHAEHEPGLELLD